MTYHSGDVIIAGDGNRYVALRNVTGGNGPATSAWLGGAQQAWALQETDSPATFPPGKQIILSSAFSLGQKPVPVTQFSYPYLVGNQLSTEFKNAHPEMFHHAKAVGRITNSSNGYGTGWIVKDKSGTVYVLTNHHVLSRADENNTILFGYEKYQKHTDIDMSSPVEIKLGSVIASSRKFDFSLIAIALSEEQKKKYGALTVADNHQTVKGDKFYMPNHGAGSPQAISSLNHAGQPATVTRDTGSDIYIAHDAAAAQIRGSSGSPLLSTANHQVIGLHRSGYGDYKNLNEKLYGSAVNMRYVKDEIRRQSGIEL